MTVQLLEMTISRDEFLRLLPAAVGREAVVDEAGVFRGSDGPCRWVIRLDRLADRQAGALALARHRVEIILEGYSPEAAAAFMARFHRQFQRGGG